jgi:hypothetical protein
MRASRRAAYEEDVLVQLLQLVPRQLQLHHLRRVCQDAGQMNLHHKAAPAEAR